MNDTHVHLRSVFRDALLRKDLFDVMGLWDSIYYPKHIILFVDENDVVHWK